jgi:hypothetical protein
VLVQTAGDIPEEAEMFWLGVLIGLFLGTAFSVLLLGTWLWWAAQVVTNDPS